MKNMNIFSLLWQDTDMSEAIMNVMSVKSCDEDTAESDAAGEDDKGLGRDLEDEDFDEGISDISTQDTIINPSSSNSR